MAGCRSTSPLVLLNCRAFYTFPRLPPIKAGRHAHPTEGFWQGGEKPILALTDVGKEDMMGSLSEILGFLLFEETQFPPWTLPI